MRLLGMLVMRDEADRYLLSCLQHMEPLLDGMAIYDDQSVDDSVELAKDFTPHVQRRPHDVPAFMEHEAVFRQAAWEYLEAALQPESDDVICCFDADEFLVGRDDDLWMETRQTAYSALADKANVIQLRIPEVFGFSVTGQPMIRMDGFWKSTMGKRFFRWRPHAQFWPKKMGCGSGPVYPDEQVRTVDNLSLLHLGYADYEDRIRKSAFYRSLDHGHNPEHIASILTEPQVVEWTGPVPMLRRGQ